VENSKKEIKEEFEKTDKRITDLEEKSKIQIKNQENEFERLKQEQEDKLKELDKQKDYIIRAIVSSLFSEAIAIIEFLDNYSNVTQEFTKTNVLKHFFNLGQYYDLISNGKVNVNEVDLYALKKILDGTKKYNENFLPTNYYLVMLLKYRDYAKNTNKVEHYEILNEIYKELKSKFQGKIEQILNER
jgi:hypothetical protein